MKKCLTQAFDTAHVVIVDESEKHKDHSHAAGGGHYKILVVSRDFDGLSRIQRHQKIYTLFEGDIPQRIHALSIKALTPDEYKRRDSTLIS